MRRAHQDGMHLLSAVLPLAVPPLLLILPLRQRVVVERRWADTSCMSPSCKRGVTRLTSIVLVDGHAYRAMDRWAGDDKGTARGHRDGHAPRCPGSHRRYHRLPRNNARPWLGLRNTQLNAGTSFPFLASRKWGKCELHRTNFTKVVRDSIRV